MQHPDEGRSEVTQAAAATKGNRLTIGHLLLWMAGTALVLVTFPSDWIPLRSVPSDRTAFLEQLQRHDNTEKVLTVIVAPLYGSAIACLPIAGQRWLERRGGFPSQPGHWLLVLLGLLYLLVALAARFQGTLVHPPASVVAFLLVAALAVAATVAVIEVREPTVWLFTFRIALAAAVMLVVACLVSVWDRGHTSLFTFSAVLFANAGILGFIAAVRDIFVRERYDLFHWLGVSTLAASLAAPVMVHGIGAWLF